MLFSLSNRQGAGPVTRSETVMRPPDVGGALRGVALALVLLLTGCVTPWDDRVLVLAFDGFLRVETVEPQGSACGVALPEYE